jgi:hypothetical protein
MGGAWSQLAAVPGYHPLMSNRASDDWLAEQMRALSPEERTEVEAGVQADLMEMNSADPVQRYRKFYEGQSWYWRAWNRFTWGLFVLKCRLRGKNPMQEFAYKVFKP